MDPAKRKRKTRVAKGWVAAVTVFAAMQVLAGVVAIQAEGGIPAGQNYIVFSTSYGWGFPIVFIGFFAGLYLAFATYRGVIVKHLRELRAQHEHFSPGIETDDYLRQIDEIIDDL